MEGEWSLSDDIMAFLREQYTPKALFNRIMDLELQETLKVI